MFHLGGFVITVVRVEVVFIRLRTWIPRWERRMNLGRLSGSGRGMRGGAGADDEELLLCWGGPAIP